MLFDRRFNFRSKNGIKKVISIPIGATGTILKSIRKYLSNNRRSTESRNNRK
jgi:hypothetical protein